MERNVLDTHALIWFIEGDKQLSKRKEKKRGSDAIL
jgi:PIN domain nuclease of toxin-antitoxin system